MQGAEGPGLVAEPAPRSVRDPAWRRTTHAQAEVAKAAQYADRETRCAGTTTAGPLMTDELPMVDADPSIRVGPRAVVPLRVRQV